MIDEIKLADGKNTILVSPEPELLQKHNVTDDQIRSRNEHIKTIEFFKNQEQKLQLRLAAISALAIKADRSGLGELYQKIVATNSMQAIIADWKDTGNTTRAIEGMEGIQGSVKAVLDKKVGDKGRTIRDYLENTMMSASKNK